eukprot:5786692-Pyramimonas_sp.AAC.1
MIRLRSAVECRGPGRLKSASMFQLASRSPTREHSSPGGPAARAPTRAGQEPRRNATHWAQK